MFKLKIFALLVLGSCGVVFASSEQVAPEESTIKSDHDAVTLSTELRPPPLLAAGEHHGIVHLINLFVVRDKIDETSEDKSENSLKSDSSEIIGPLASLLFVVDDDGEEGPLDDLTKLVVEADYEAEDKDSEKDIKEVKVDPIFIEASQAETEKPKKLKKIRSKRTLFRKNKVCSSCSGGNGGNYGYSGGGGYPYGGGSQPGYSILVVPVTVSEGGGGNYHGGGYQGGHTGGGGGHIRPYPSPGHYPGGSGNQWGGGGGGGGGGGNAYAEAHATADARAYGR